MVKGWRSRHARRKRDGWREDTVSHCQARSKERLKDREQDQRKIDRTRKALTLPTRIISGHLARFIAM